MSVRPFISYNRHVYEVSEDEVSGRDRDDSGLWKQFRDGNESAFIRIYSDHYESLYHYGYQVSGDIGLVEDCIQDLFLDLRKNRGRLGNTDNIRLYLFKSLRRKIIREKSKWFKKFEAFSGDCPQWIAFSHEQYLIDQQLAAEDLQKLQSAILSLTPKKREILYYFYFENLSYEEIRVLMGVSHVKSVRNLLYETLALLRKSW